ncbi:MAG: cation diffusion facilitator family transporter [Gammaproteobacteria bacterium]|nr:cation diffusion facilitator family transporter [Gammaproteobacteria bacterium]NNF59904.1 cation diffusion facilitator family transporter [Gammaproteobacteria bacterium]NNM21638.1 cation diffusion facilitator family transporter [Gammaproteobacteria bacterium]
MKEHPSARTARLLRLATNASVATALILIVVKLVAWLLSDAVSILASLVDSMMDAVTSVINLVAVRYSLTPADDEHRFGHGKAESLAALGQSAFIVGSAVFLVLHATERLIHPVPLQQVRLGIGVIVFATVITLMLLALQRYVIRETQSDAIRADSLHYTSDVLVNLSVIAALLFSTIGWQHADALFGIAVAGYICWGAWQIGSSAVNALMDRELPEEIQLRLRGIATSHPGVHGVHEMRTRRSGRDYFVQMHLEFDDAMPLVEAHAIGDSVEASIRNEFPNADVLIHHDPVSAGSEA